MLGLSIACVLAAVAWAYLLAGHGGFWRTTERLPTVTRDPAGWPDVVAVVPARNEADMLPVTLPTLLGQDYPGALSVILVDDCSSDGTAEVAAEIGRASGRPLRVIPGAPQSPSTLDTQQSPCIPNSLSAIDTPRTPSAAPSPDSEPSPGSEPSSGSGLARGSGPSDGAGRLGRQGLGHGAGPGRGGHPVRRGARTWVRTVHRRRHRLGAPGAARSGRRGGGGRPGPSLPDGAAARRHRVGADRRPCLRLLLRPALSVPAGERPRVAYRGRGRGLHAGAPGGAAPVGRARADQRRAHRRRRAGADDQASGRTMLARAVHPGGQRPPVSADRPPVADGGQVRLHPAELLPAAAARDGHRTAVSLCSAARRGDRRPGDPGRGGLRGRGWPSSARGRSGPGRMGADVADLPAHAAAVPAVAAAGARPAADCPAVRRDDRGLGAAALRGPRRRVEGADHRLPVTLAEWLLPHPPTARRLATLPPVRCGPPSRRTAPGAAISSPTCSPPARWRETSSPCSPTRAA